jgi:hypothetical protein
MTSLNQSDRSLSGQIDCGSRKEQRKSDDRCPDAPHMEAFRMVDESLPILGWRAVLPGERGAVDRNHADDPDENHAHVTLDKCLSITRATSRGTTCRARLEKFHINEKPVPGKKLKWKIDDRKSKLMFTL